MTNPAYSPWLICARCDGDVHTEDAVHCDGDVFCERCWEMMQPELIKDFVWDMLIRFSPKETRS